MPIVRLEAGLRTLFFTNTITYTVNLLNKKWKVVVRLSCLLAEFLGTTLEIECVKRKLFLYFHAPRISQVMSRLSNLPVLKMRSALFCAERTYVGSLWS